MLFNRYLGFYYDSNGQLHSTGGSDADTETVQAIVSTSISGSLAGCIAIDFDLGGDLVVVDCAEEYPYVCAEPAGEMSEFISVTYTANTVVLTGVHRGPHQAFYTGDKFMVLAQHPVLF